MDRILLTSKVTSIILMRLKPLFLYFIAAFVLEFRTVDTDKPVTDQHRCLETFCETLEAILRKGIKRKL